MFKAVPEPPKTPASEPMLIKSKKSPLKRSQSSENVARANGKNEENDVARLTLSQPALNKPNDLKHQSHSRHGSGIMLRPDVLYQGSMTSLARFRGTSPERVVLREPSEAPVQRCGWLPCSEEFKDALSEMLDLSLLIDPIFILFSLSNFLTSIGFYIPYVYTVPMSEKLGIANPAYLISIIGASNLVGRIILGYISDKPWVNRLLAYNLCLTIAGISKYILLAYIFILFVYGYYRCFVCRRYWLGDGMLGILGSSIICDNVWLHYWCLRRIDFRGTGRSTRH